MQEYCKSGWGQEAKARRNERVQESEKQPGVAAEALACRPTKDPRDHEHGLGGGSPWSAPTKQPGGETTGIATDNAETVESDGRKYPFSTSTAKTKATRQTSAPSLKRERGAGSAERIAIEASQLHCAKQSTEDNTCNPLVTFDNHLTLVSVIPYVPLQPATVHSILPGAAGPFGVSGPSDHPFGTTSNMVAKLDSARSKLPATST
jgi:hypothetical protein